MYSITQPPIIPGDPQLGHGFDEPIATVVCEGTPEAWKFSDLNAEESSTRHIRSFVVLYSIVG
jgi:hypothetical protein